VRVNQPVNTHVHDEYSIELEDIFDTPSAEQSTRKPLLTAALKAREGKGDRLEKSFSHFEPKVVGKEISEELYKSVPDHLLSYKNERKDIGEKRTIQAGEEEISKHDADSYHEDNSCVYDDENKELLVEDSNERETKCRSSNISNVLKEERIGGHGDDSCEGGRPHDETTRKAELHVQDGSDSHQSNLDEEPNKSEPSLDIESTDQGGREKAVAASAQKIPLYEDDKEEDDEVSSVETEESEVDELEEVHRLVLTEEAITRECPKEQIAHNEMILAEENEDESSEYEDDSSYTEDDSNECEDGAIYEKVDDENSLFEGVDDDDHDDDDDEDSYKDDDDTSSAIEDDEDEGNVMNDSLS